MIPASDVRWWLQELEIAGSNLRANTTALQTTATAVDYDRIPLKLMGWSGICSAGGGGIWTGRE